MDNYQILGIAKTASLEEAKRAYRKLAQNHHPDKNGDAEKFKEIKRAWEEVEKELTNPKTTSDSGWSPFSKTGFAKQSSNKPRTETHAGKAAHGYEARGPRSMPRTRTVKLEHIVDLEISSKHAFEGCVVPFVHDNMVLEYTVRPGSSEKTVKELFARDERIGSNLGFVNITINLRIVDKHPNEQKETVKAEDHHITYKICALGLFSGGKIEARDSFNEKVQIQIPMGFDPSKPIIVKEKGYGPRNNRGDLHIKIEPIFKTPAELSANELKMLDRINQAVRK